MKYQSEIEMDMPAVIDPITIGAVIVTYRPDIGLFTRIVAAVSEQAAGVMVFDNSDDAAHASRIKSTLPDDVHYRWRQKPPASLTCWCLTRTVCRIPV